MQNAVASHTNGGGKDPAPPDFHMVLIYEDFRSGLRGKEFFDSLVRHHGSLFRFLCHLWKLELLEVPELGETARTEADNADMLVIATRDGADLPSEARAWFERWLHHPPAAGALVALLERDRTDADGVATYLSQVAARGRMRFFCQVTVALEGETLRVPEIMTRPAPRSLSAPAGNLSRSFVSPHADRILQST